jgi:hypothetical protein
MTEETVAGNEKPPLRRSAMGQRKWLWLECVVSGCCLRNQQYAKSSGRVVGRTRYRPSPLTIALFKEPRGVDDGKQSPSRARH